MIQLQEALERVTYGTPDFPKEEFRIIRENFEEAKPYLYAAIDKALTEKEFLEDHYELHFYAMFFLAEFKDTGSFEKMMKLVALPSDILEKLIGDLVTDGLSDILYNTYNGNMELLKDSARNQEISVYARSAVLYVMGQIYLDGGLDRKEWQEFLIELADTEEDDEGEIFSWIAGMICNCHLMELLPLVKELFEEGKVDAFIFGEYDSCVDIMFSYDDNWSRELCTPQISADRLESWAMFEQENKDGDSKSFDKMWKAVQEEYTQQPEKKIKVGRNDPCPCGSGKKYKHCCLNKPKEEQQPESEQEKQRWLKDYPQTGTARVEGRIYLEDYFDQESIEIDKLLYLALKHRAVPVWNREKHTVVAARKKYYLWAAFSRFRDKMEKEGITAAEEYDKKYSIHYTCREWIGELLSLLKESGEQEKYNEVLKYGTYSS